MTLQEEMNEKAHDSQKNILIVKQESFEKHTILKYTCTKIFLFTNLDTKKMFGCIVIKTQTMNLSQVSVSLELFVFTSFCFCDTQGDPSGRLE